MEDVNYFSSDAFKASAMHFVTLIDNHAYTEHNVLSSFEKQLCNTLSNILNNMIQFPQLWGERCALKTEEQNSHLTFILNESSTDINHTQNIYAELYFYIIEAVSFSPSQPSSALSSYFDFGLEYLDEFEEESKRKIYSALLRLPVSILNKSLGKLNVEGYHKSLLQIESTEKKLASMQIDLEKKIKRVERLEAQLKNQETAYNFVGLYKGFVKLGTMKSAELKESKRILLGLATVIPLLILAEVIYFALSGKNDTTVTHIIKLIPLASLVLILLYYFRVVLSSFNSIKSQLMQIELRKSLCRFIQKYGEYSKEINANSKEGDRNPLAKFEDIIFSNIMASDDKTPSTFDGMEQLASMIKAVKGS
ncbi:hypothetical protein ACI0ZV_001707 [Cronobacter sakazakii]|nr:hypothetical protein [Cronobacter sakazakii]